MMTYETARVLLNYQERNLCKIRDVRLEYDGYEYRIDYRGGFSSYVAIDRRAVGKRNFKYFGGFGAYDCRTAQQVLDRARREIGIPSGGLAC